MAAVSWADVKELDIAEAKKACAFEVRREDLLSNENNLKSKFKLVSVKMPGEEDFTRLGEVNQNRPFIPYSEAVDWVNEQLSSVGSDYKLFRAAIEEKTKALFHQYIFKDEVASPDGHSIAPSVCFRASYQGWRPALEILFGTYRFVCDNGAIVGFGDNGSIRVNSHNWTTYTKTGIADKFRDAFGRLQDISKLYHDLDKVTLSEKYADVFSSKAFSVALRKKVLSMLEMDGKVVITKESEKKDDLLLKTKLLEEADFKIENIASAIQVSEDVPLWDVYNAFTRTVSTAANSAKFITDSQRVNNVFRKMVA